MQKLASRFILALRGWEVPRDGTRRYLYDIWQPLTLLVITTSFAAAFFTTFDPYASTSKDDRYFFCNADGNVQKADYRYRPFWDPQLYFTVSIAFGQFSFSSAKIIDAAWDTIIGRGGQIIAATVAYQPLRRSFTLTMESCSVTIPTITSLFCQHIQLESVGRLVHNVFWHRGSVHLPWRQPVFKGRARLSMQIFACTYVLFFATLVSVMTGYRAQLSGYFGYDANQDGQLFPIAQLGMPRMIVYDGSRIGLQETPMYVRDAIVFPGNASDDDGYTSSFANRFDTNDFIASSRDMESPYGELLDYYYTCNALQMWIYNETYYNTYYNDDHDQTLATTPMNVTARSLDCAIHKCSCSTPVLQYDSSFYKRQLYGNMTSTITIDDQRWDLAAPPISVGIATSSWNLPSLSNIGPNATLENASEFWSGSQSYPYPVTSLLNGSSASSNIGLRGLYMHSDTVIEEATIKKTGRCIAEDAYSWGFSSLLLLTFCSYTFLFALTLIVLQTDVYWNSRHDRDHQSHSIYTDVLYLAEELKNTFRGDVHDHVQSPKDFNERVEHWKQGLRLDVSDLPLSRWQEFRLSRTTKRKLRKLKSTPESIDNPPLEFHSLGPQNRDWLPVPDTAYHGLNPFKEPESDLEIHPGSDQRHTSGQLTPSFASTSRSAEPSISDTLGLIANAAKNGILQGTDEVDEDTWRST